MENKRLNKTMAVCAIVFNSALLTGALFFLSSGYAQEQKAEVTFYEDRTFVIENGIIRIQGDYIFTNPSSEEIDYTQESLKFKSNGTVILR